jgi:hypothetical protein
MSSNRWEVRKIRGIGPTKNARGQPAMNGTSFDVELIGLSGRHHIEVAVTTFAHSQLQALGFTDEEAVRTYVERQLTASSENRWTPETHPWLTIDSHSIGGLLVDLKSKLISSTATRT